jgi:transposase
MRVIGLDIHRVFAEAVALQAGRLTRLVRVEMRRDRLTAFARSLTHDDHVVIEATGNAAAVAEALRPHAGRVVIANPQQVRLIAHAKIKTDRVDASVLARLYASGYLPEVWERDLARDALADERAKQLMTILGIHMVVAVGIMAAIGPIERFASPQQLVSYFGLNPSIHQSGNGPVHRGRITKRGRGHARGMLVEAAWVAARVPGPLRAFFLRIRARRGQHVAAVASARKLAVLIWHMLRRGEDYAWVRPALHARKIRDLELRAGHPVQRGQRGAAYAYNLSTVRQRERRRVEQAERADERLVKGWTQHGPKVRTGAAKEERQERQ